MSDKPTICLVMTRFPYPLDQGDKLRAFHQLKELSNYFELLLICISDKKVSQSEIDQVAPFTKDLQIHYSPKSSVIGGFL